VVCMYEYFSINGDVCMNISQLMKI
jgi:hypothetical protein